MPGRTRQDVEDRYRNDMEAAESFRDVDNGRYAELVSQAKERRYDALEALVAERETAAATAQLEATRARVATQYPLADPKLITGGTPEEIEASAKALNDFAKKNRDEAEAAARGASRAARSGAYRDGVPASAPQAGGSRTPDREAQEDAQAAKDRNDALRAQSGLPGDLRDRAIVGRSEEETLMDIRRSGRASALSMQGFKARNEGTAVLVDSSDMPGKLSEEDRRG
jgi:hypothetical protein